MRKWYPIVLIAAVTAVSVIVYPQLPDRVPIHWNLHGQVDGYGSKWVRTVLLPLVLVGMWGLLRLLPTIDPRPENYAKMQSTYDLVVNSALTVLALAHFAVVAATYRLPIPTARVGGYLLVAAGILAVGASFLPIDVAASALGVVGVGAALGAVVYSYFAWKQETHQ